MLIFVAYVLSPMDSAATMLHSDCLQSLGSLKFLPLCGMLTLDKLNLFIMYFWKFSANCPMCVLRHPT